ncbi:MAG: DUF4430 domain-containing protein [Clostridiales bacterium]|nr:DUF4430 domain-containing protein [Clostridiales bacterium]
MNMKKKLLSMMLALSVLLSSMPMMVSASDDESEDTMLFQNEFAESEENADDTNSAETDETEPAEPDETTSEPETDEPAVDTEVPENPDEIEPTETAAPDETTSEPETDEQPAETEPGDESESENKAKPTNIKLKPKITGVMLQYAIIETDNFDPDKTEYHLQTILTYNNRRNMGFKLTVEHSDPENTEMVVNYVSARPAKSVTLTGDDAALNKEIVISDSVWQNTAAGTDTSKLEIILTNGGDTITYTIWIHTANTVPVSEITYTFDGDDTKYPQCDLYSVNGGSYVDVFLTPDTPDDALLTFDFDMAYGVETDWDRTVQLVNGEATLNVRTYIADSIYSSGSEYFVKYHFYRDSDASLESLTPQGGQPIKLKSAVNEYYCYLPDGAEDGDTFTVEAAAKSQNATVTVESGTIANGRADAYVTVVAGDGNTSETYTIHAYSSDGAADELCVLNFYIRDYKTSGSALDSERYEKIALEFDPQQTEYWLDVDFPSSETSSQYIYAAYQALAANSDSSVTCDYTELIYSSYYKDRHYDVAPGERYNAFNANYLDYDAAFKFTVNPAEEGVEAKVYTVYLRNSALAPSEEARLSDISYALSDSEELITIPNFKSDTTEYEIHLPFGVETVVVNETRQHPGSEVTGEHTLTIGEDGIAETTLHVVSYSKNTSKDYHVVFVGKLSSAYAKDIAYICGDSEKAAIEVFDKNKTVYDVVLSEDVEDGAVVNLAVTAESETAQIVLQPATIKDGMGTATVEIIDGEVTMTYTVNFHVGHIRYANNALANLEIFNKSTLEPYGGDIQYFTPDKTEYDVDLAKGESQFGSSAIRATLPEGSNATITIHYHQYAIFSTGDNYLDKQCVRAALESGVDHIPNGALIETKGTFQDITITVTPEEGEARVYTLHVHAGTTDEPVYATSFEMYPTYADAVIADGTRYVISEGGNGHWGTYKDDRTFYIPYDSGVRNGDTITVVPTTENFLIEREPEYTGVLTDGRADIPMTFTNQLGEKKTITYHYILLSEQDSIREFSQIYYETEDGQIHLVDINSVEFTDKDSAKVKIIVPEMYSKSEKIIATGVNKRDGSLSRQTVSLSNGEVATYLQATSKYGSPMVSYRCEFILASASESNAYASSAFYTIGSGEQQKIKNVVSSTYEYNIPIDENVTDGTPVSITLYARNAKAVISGDTKAVIKNGEAAITLTITSADGTQQEEYTFHFARTFEASHGLGFESVTYKIDSSDKTYKVNGVSSFGKNFTVNLPTDTADDAKLTFFPKVWDETDITISGDTTITLQNGKGTLKFVLTNSAGLSNTITISICKVQGLMSVYEYLPIGSQYTNKGFGNAPVIYTKGMTLTAPPNNWMLGQTVGNFGGYMTYQLSTPLKNDPANPYGIDFIVYGNGQGSTGYVEPASVWVAQDKDGDGQPDKWYELAGSAFFDATTVWNYEVTYSKGENNTTDYKTSDGYAGHFNYEYPDISKYGALGAAVGHESVTVRATKLDENMIPRFGYGDVHSNDEGDIETPLNPYDGTNPMFADFGVPLEGYVRGDSMDISWAVDEEGNPVALDEITFIRLNNARFVLHSAFGEQSAEICAVVPLYGNEGKEAVGVTDSLSEMTFVDKNGKEIRVPFTDGEYSYDIALPKVTDYSIFFDEAVREANNIYINNDYADSEGYALSKTILTDSGVYKMRVVVQEKNSEKEPILYYLTFSNEVAPKWKVTFNANGGLVDGSENISKYYYEADVGVELPTPEKQRYEFDGWYTDDGVRYTTITEDTPTELTLTARWHFVGLPETEKKIRVSFRLIGSSLAMLVDENDSIDLGNGDYKGAEYQTWLPTEYYELNENSTVYDLLYKALDGKLQFTGAKEGYIDTIYAPDVYGGHALSEFTNGKRSGWMYTIDGSHPNVGLLDYVLKDGESVIWHYVNDYAYEVEDWFNDPNYPSLGDGSYYNSWLKAADSLPTEPITPDEPVIPIIPNNPSEPDKPEDKKDPLISIEKNTELPTIIFTDIENHWAKNEIQEAYEYGLIKGVTGPLEAEDGSLTAEFAPDVTLTRAMIVTMLFRMDGGILAEGTAEAPFTDLVPDNWYNDAIAWAYANDITKGTSDTSFSPDKAVTREEIAVFIMRFAEYKGMTVAVSDTSLASYEDTDNISSWATDAMAFAVEYELIRGRTETTLVPEGQATRAEAAVIMLRMIMNLMK